ncbi:2-amino-4-hydroxy-6-hydroxymethyldihydropteridine diphosphokinase [Candidatus Riesia pediculischaeffi]|uniref:2-amino-4-hydroxy-6-hydroxymethyldihydropteridine pyrophosphokinase n=2 Tax=Candidatus Riesia pediculischaeffi TaxID=428411 RepID=A0A1V0HKM8_9ENTR|nr:2-amino-4-hydroxy-6-hydroxymethyldihydropteridine diphosphokinase [Candidatus Riesia pediculischaeffi]ARC53373.1 2-amino-4-hydroxy-6-hydroxymethyldihydropteridine pyrophosphokinase [Candidatus Riesia pediculischaeffi]KIE63865.1 2-amino-4-hydroxy-6- hydroxymethyldihydropteridine pyrophosphokinase [Candidatus Riesia pediculischaeffi PTSU]
MKKFHETYISIGSNLNNPVLQANRSIFSLRKLPNTKITSISSYYRTLPIGNLKQPYYLNAIVVLKTQLTPENLLRYIQRIESNQGRIRKQERWCSRAIDLDILLYGNLIVRKKNLIIPHAELKNRYFLLRMIYEENPDLKFPDGESVLEIIKKCKKSSISFWKDEIC